MHGELFRHAHRPHAIAVHQRERHIGFDQKLRAAFHALAEHQARAAHFNDFGAHREQVARSMNARYCAWNTTPPASVS